MKKQHPNSTIFLPLAPGNLPPQKKISETVSDCYFFHPTELIFPKDIQQKKLGYNGVCGFMSREGWKIFPELTSFIVDIYIYEDHQYMAILQTCHVWGDGDLKSDPNAKVGYVTSNI